MLAILLGENTSRRVEHGIPEINDSFLIREIIRERQVCLYEEGETP